MFLEMVWYLVAVAPCVALQPVSLSGLHINLERFAPLDVNPDSSFLGWSCYRSSTSSQEAFALRVFEVDTGTLIWNGTCHDVAVNCKQSDNIPLHVFPFTLRLGTSYDIQVQHLDAGMVAGPWSKPLTFATALPAVWPGHARPIWAANLTQNFVL